MSDGWLLIGSEYFLFQFAIQNLMTEIFSTIILRFVLYGCETWLVTLCEELRLKMFANRVLRGIFVPK